MVHLQRDSTVERGAMGETEMKIDVGFSGTAVGDLKGAVDFVDTERICCEWTASCAEETLCPRRVDHLRIGEGGSMVLA